MSTEYIPGSPNVGVHIPQKFKTDEGSVDKKFHHASLVGEDDELATIEQMHTVSPYIWCSSWDIATDMTMLQKNNIKFVLSLSPNRKDEPTLASMKKLGIVHLHLPVENVPDWNPEADSLSTERIEGAPEESEEMRKRREAEWAKRPKLMHLRDALPLSHAFIKRAVKLKRYVLVHDDQGTSTAAAAVAHYLLRWRYEKGPTDKNALPLFVNMIKVKRPCVDINFGFLELLEDMESELSGRTVAPSQSLSIRRNRLMMAKETKNMQKTVDEEKAQADAKWKSETRKKIL